MSKSGVGFGGFLLGLGVGWYTFRLIEFSLDIFSWILIIIGAGMIINALISRDSRASPIRGLFGGFAGGIIVALFLTQGFAIVETVTNEVTPSNYKVSENRTLSGGVTQNKLALTVNDKNGGINLETWDNPGYRIDLMLKANGATTSDAQRNLQNLNVMFTDTTVVDTQKLDLEFQTPSNIWSNYLVVVDAKVPKDVLVLVELTTSNGEISLTDINASNIVLHTSNGMISLGNVYCETLDGETSNGKISGLITAESADLSTSNGSVDITVSEARNGTYSFETSNGAISISTTRSEDTGFSFDLSTSLGSTTINLPNMSYTTNESRNKIAETTGFENKPIQIKITAQTSLGSITVN
jgi:DUF4097 and DUF4098 domain-containing protein YvlB